MPSVIVVLSANVADAQRQTWLGPLQGLTLAFLMATQHQGLFWRVEVKADADGQPAVG